MLVDTHAHLADPQFDPDREETLQRAMDAGVGFTVEIADGEEEWAKARALAEAHPDRMRWTAGLHPHHADKFDAGTVPRLLEALKHPLCVAVGEIGLDYYRNPLPPDLQKGVFSSLLEAAAREGKPAVIHCREADGAARAAQQDILDIVKRVYGGAPGPHGVVHCFQGHLDFAQAFIAQGFFLGVDGPLTYPKAGVLRALFKEIPLEHLVLETDSPYLPPQPQRGKRNEPSYIKGVAEELARLKGVPLQELERRTTANAGRLYKLPFLS